MLDNLKQHPKWVEFKANHSTANAMIMLLAAIMFWRGIWGLLDLYLFPGYPALSYLICIAIGGIVLYLDGLNLNNLQR